MKYLWNLLIAACAMATTADGALISEFVANPPSNDPATQDFELAGTPLAPFDLWIISIESDGFNGTVDRSTNVMGSYDAGGLAVVTVPDLENPSFTVALLGLASDPFGVDLDPLDNGTIDFSLLDTPVLMDAVGIPDAPGDEAATTAYATAFGGVSFVNPGGEPESVFREAATGDWYAHWPFAITTFPVTDLSGADVNPALFDIDPTLGPTFGSTNPALAIPEPSSVIALAAFGVAGVVRRRHRSS